MSINNSLSVCEVASMILFYIIMVVLSILNISTLILLQNKRSNLYLMILFIFIAISNWGYLQLALSQSLESAILANQIVYIGGVYSIECMLLLIIQICNYKLNKVAHFVLYAIPMLVIIFVSTIGYSEIYYKNVDIINLNGVTALKREYGPVHNLYYILLFGYILLTISIVVYTLIKGRSVSFFNLFIFAIIEVIGISIFIGGKLINSSIELLPMVYILDEFVLLYIFRRINMYDVEYNVVASMEEKSTNGYILLKKNMLYIGCNKVASSIFNELNKVRIDFPFNNKEGICGEIPKWIDELEKNEEKEELSKSYKMGEKHYQCNVKYLYYNERECGYIIEVIDDTAKHNYIELLNSYNTELVNEVEEKTSHIMAIQDKILYTMSNMVENRDVNTGGHINRTSHVVKILVDKIKMDKDINLKPGFGYAVIKAAPMHDLGKITIDDSILRKPGRLTEEEYKIMQNHSVAGAKMVEKILEDVEDENFIKIAVNIAKHHHEKWNGTGYPNKLSKENIPLEARIMAIADVYDALVSKRCYKEKMSFEEANKVILESMGSHFDPGLRKYYEMARPEIEEYYKSQGE